MYMAPITRARAAPAPTALRRLVGLPVLVVAGVAGLAWMLAVGVVAGVMLAARFGLQAIDYAGTVALGR